MQREPALEGVGMYSQLCGTLTTFEVQSGVLVVPVMKAPKSKCRGARQYPIYSGNAEEQATLRHPTRSSNPNLTTMSACCSKVALFSHLLVIASNSAWSATIAAGVGGACTQKPLVFAYLYICIFACVMRKWGVGAGDGKNQTK